MLLGNDFMPKTHWFSIAEGGFEKLLSAYWQIHNHTEIFLVDVYAMTINTEMLCDLIYIVKSLEHTSIIKLFEKRKTQRINIKSYMTEQERQQTLIDFYPLQYLNIEQAIEIKDIPKLRLDNNKITILEIIIISKTPPTFSNVGF